MAGEIEIFLGDVNDVEGRVYARFKGPASMWREDAGGGPIVLHGTLRGPYCGRAQTLPAEYTFHDLGPKNSGLAEVVVPDPCTWSRELPHLYHAAIEARQADRVIAAYHGKIGLRRATEKND